MSARCLLSGGCSANSGARPRLQRLMLSLVACRTSFLFESVLGPVGIKTLKLSELITAIAYYTN